MTQWTRLPEHVHAAVADKPGSILLETSRFDSSNQHSYLFQNPVSVIVANRLDEIPQLFSQIEAALADGFHVAGFFSYEAGYHFERFAGSLSAEHELPLAWLGVYKNPLAFDHLQGSFHGQPFTPPSNTEPEEEPIVTSGNIALGITHEEYRAKISTIKEYIASGETYQVNFTDAVSFHTQASASSAFQTLSRQQPVAYSAFMNVADHHILSFSPELFFRIDDGRIVTRPMKGTMARGLDTPEDVQAALRLQRDEKNRSEHVMIVDLLRNDLGRICNMGTVQVDDLFSVERYETLLQMTSTVSGVLRPGIKYYDIFRGMFPSGSITGAPKIRTMQIIRELEQMPRGVYTGAIGFISPTGSAVFNVAIRTVVMKDGNARMGVGGGIVADSDAQEEYRECLLKASFLTRPRRDFQLIETMRWEKDLSFLPMHLDRLESSASYFNFVFHREAARLRLQELSRSFRAGAQYKVRLLLDRTGELTLSTSELSAEPSTRNINIKLSQETTSSTDPLYRHKTTQRDIYDRQYLAACAEGFDEVLFTNERGEVTEGAISNVFIEQSGKLLTPPLTCGVLPGIFRRHLLETRAAMEEKVLTIADLQAADAVFLCNSVRGIRKVKALRLDASTVTKW